MVRHSLKTQLQAAGAAFQFMTRLPVPLEIPFTPAVLAKSVVYYPLVGAVIGGIAGAAGWFLSLWVPVLPSSVLILLIWTVLSGALHLDGLMDTADGVLSYRSREKMLEIMKDSRVGAMGVIAVIILMLLKFSTLAALLESEGRWTDAVPLMVMACGWSRLWVVVSMVGWPFARPGEGLAILFSKVRRSQVSVTVVVQLTLAAAAGMAWGLSLPELGLIVLVQGALTLLCGMLLSRYFTRRLGGLTGDTYGALIEILECMLLFSLLWLI
ncbi:adenosylcobinamide-GDP ribazoletransferase [Paenibacillus nasutitermitis]|uniref:Adenosylcobinamide-GDP ribazoletransferase n=1 Tax=Paenibacillus nasutitermitis TaxID=1652958 RepID=A0A916YYU8_9BACL|nr:adenosylcobinamide-GDP ribazoletransferase [Paenibacillus nasutitermitis]GGD67548.1 adenosylcobinamide-GDP ribazoletransferase [Paenibacillus nasutitermitis]